MKLLRQWLKGIAPHEKLFPLWERQKAAVMVKKDLIRAGIPDKTEDGFADFHDADGHSHITKLLHDGTSRPEAKEIARHSDIKMTMKYTHIGIGDQAKPIANLPAPRCSPLPRR